MVSDRSLQAFAATLSRSLVGFSLSRQSAQHLGMMHQTFERARAAAGIMEWPDNALRHSFATYHLAHFKDSAALALEMGHIDSGMIFEHYRELVRPKEAERYWSIRPAAREKIVPLVART